ncbi:MAG: trypsin-like peptidase domain-containing protein [Chloroflexota bacterium]|nr:MAG: trypsin-like peptidase domain-containing protein [Chloroflexota bacterium]
MRIVSQLHIFLLASVMILVLAACAQNQESNPAAPASAVDTDEIVATVMAQIEADLGEPALADAPQSEQASADFDLGTVVSTVVEEVEARLAERQPQPVMNEEPTPEITGDALQNGLIDLYRRANPAVVFIIVPPIGSGSGFVFSQDGYIVTNNHVVENGREYEVVFAGGERRDAELVGADVDSDLAVIKVDALPDGVQPLPLGSSDDLAVGQFVVAIGNPFGEQGSMSLGIVSGLGRSLRSQRELQTGSSYSLPQVVQTDAPINPGNSGGPLLNLDGEVVGVNSAIASTSGSNSGVGFSIPVKAVRRIVPSLIDDGSFEYPYMGAAFEDEISLDDQNTFDLPQTSGAYVVSITDGSPADEAGLRAASGTTGRGGDLIIAIDENPIVDFDDLNSYLALETVVGQTILIRVLRDGQTLDLPLTLGERP